MLCARPRWMYASCQWQRLSKAAAEGASRTSLRKRQRNGRKRLWHLARMRVRSGDLRGITQNNKYVVLSHEITSQDCANNGLAAPSGSSQHCCRPVESQRHSTSTAVGARTPYPLRRSLLAFGIEPGQPRDAHARHANARARRSQVDGAARNSQRHVSVASQRRVGRRTAVGRSGSCATRRGTGRDPGPCSPCTAAVSRAVDARVHTELGSHAKPGCTCVACHFKPATGLPPIWYRVR